MYIKSIRAQGFKSFADKIELDFNKGISAIVGPNGSGKSNVVDAILWVLGEQSVKSLRGDSAMSDVIFSGSKTREEQKKASVAILFDNSDHALNSSLTEVEIKRVIYKTGENEYYINNSHVRLKDITDLLIDVTSKFNIVTQGNINALVENKSSERRVLFESAAGVLKYKKRKEESLKKLDGTKENLMRVNLIIKELNTTLEPLKTQKEDAEKYLEIKKNLENVEISLLASDITSINEKYEKLKLEQDSLSKEADLMTSTGFEELEKLKLEAIKYDDEIKNINASLLHITEEVSKLDTQKQITIERGKYSLDKNTIDSNLLSLNEDKLKFEKNKSVLEEELSSLKEILQKDTKDLGVKSDEEIKTKVKITNLQNEINSIKSEIYSLENKIYIEKNNIENNAYLPKSVASIINNPVLEGIHNTIGNLIEVKDSHKIAINTALSASSNFIICDDFNSAKKAINFLKDKHLGRATFFPIDTIKSRYLDNNTIKSISSYNGYVGVASDLITYKDIYKDIMENQLGNVIVVDTMDNLFDIAKKCDYKYKMVSLDGEILFPGGALSGGTSKQGHDASILTKLVSDLDNKKASLSTLEMSLKSETSKYDIFTKDIDSINKKVLEYRLTIENKENTLKENNTKLEEIISNINGLNDSAKGTLDDALNNILNELNEKIKEKEILEKKLNLLQSEKFDLNDKIESMQKKYEENNQNIHRIKDKIQSNEVEIGKCEVKLDNYLGILANDYNLTYENAKNNYVLEIDADIARSKVNKLKNELKGLVNVNLGSISEYDRLKKRYDFLDKQREDLETSSNELLSIISEMDEIMKEKFKSTFDDIAKEFTNIFRVMFKGGNGLLKLTDEDDLLNTGISILAVPPGKKLNSTAFLSGGEKALTAICLIFAILKVKPAPFIVLDEVEAALDEENVSMFGEYLSKIKDESQFILITHKKKMMEYSDLLYGITMQESGVSKLVSVRLEDAK